MRKPTAVFIETPRESDVKCELTKDGKWEVRPIDFGLTFPFAYGFIPNSWAADGDEADAVVFTHSRASAQLVYPLHLGRLQMLDNGVVDDKELFAMPGYNVTGIELEAMKFFFRNYKAGVQVGGIIHSASSGEADSPSVLPTGEWQEIERLAF